MKQRVLIRTLEVLHEIAEGATAGLGWGLAFASAASVEPLRCEGNVIYLPTSRARRLSVRS